MEPTAAEQYLLSERHHQQDKARARQERREWAKNFALVSVLVAFTVAASSLLAR